MTGWCLRGAGPRRSARAGETPGGRPRETLGDLGMHEGATDGPVGGGVHDGRVNSEEGLRCGGGLAAEEQQPEGVRGLEVAAQLLLVDVEGPRGRGVRRRKARGRPAALKQH